MNWLRIWPSNSSFVDNIGEEPNRYSYSIINGWRVYYQWMEGLLSMDGGSIINGWRVYYQWMEGLLSMDGGSIINGWRVYYQWMEGLLSMDGGSIINGWMVVRLITALYSSILLMQVAWSLNPFMSILPVTIQLFWGLVLLE